jgi:hypothetical protein
VLLTLAASAAAVQMPCSCSCVSAQAAPAVQQLFGRPALGSAARQQLPQAAASSVLLSLVPVCWQCHRHCIGVLPLLLLLCTSFLSSSMAALLASDAGSVCFDSGSACSSCTGALLLLLRFCASNISGVGGGCCLRCLLSLLVGVCSSCRDYPSARAPAALRKLCQL